MKNDAIFVRFRNKSIQIPNIGYPNSGDELQEILQNLDNFSACLGGPSMDTYKDMKLSSALADQSTGRWRHKKCEGFVPAKDGLHCRDCYKLYRSFEVAKSMDKPQKLTPRTRFRKSERQKRHLAKRCLDLENAIEELQKSFKITNECNIPEIETKLRTAGVDEVQVF